MALRLRGATSGYIELKAPASAGDNTLTLPTNNGSANTFLKTDGSGNLSWQSNLTFDGTSLKIGNNFSAHAEGDDLVIGGSGWRGMTIYGEGGGGVIQFADDAGNRDGQIMYDHGDRKMMIRTAGNANRLVVRADGSTLLSGLSDNNDTRNAGGLVLKSSSGISFQTYGSNGSKNWRLRPDDLTAWGALEFSVSPTANDATDWPDAASDVVLVLEGSKDVLVKNGNLKIGTAGKGIDFSQTNSSLTGVTVDEEVLDHFEEGTWTPTQPTVGWYANTEIEGKYQRVGHWVTASFIVRFASNGSAIAGYIDGLPYVSAGANTEYKYGGSVSYTTDSNVNSFLIENGTARIHLYNNTGGGIQLTHLDDDYVRGTVIYRVA